MNTIGRGTPSAAGERQATGLMAERGIDDRASVRGERLGRTPAQLGVRAGVPLRPVGLVRRPFGRPEPHEPLADHIGAHVRKP